MAYERIKYTNYIDPATGGVHAFPESGSLDGEIPSAYLTMEMYNAQQRLHTLIDQDCKHLLYDIDNELKGVYWRLITGNEPLRVENGDYFTTQVK